MCDKPVQRNTFVFITGKEFKKLEEKDYCEKSIISNFFWCEDPSKFNVVIIHKPNEETSGIIEKIQGQFVVLFTKGVPEDFIILFKSNFLSKKDCVVFCQDGYKLQNEKIINFTEHLGYFVTTEKLSKSHDAYFHEEERPERVIKLFSGPQPKG